MSPIIKDIHTHRKYLMLLDSLTTIHVSDISLSNLRDKYFIKSGTLSIQSFAETQVRQEHGETDGETGVQT